MVNQKKVTNFGKGSKMRVKKGRVDENEREIRLSEAGFFCGLCFCVARLEPNFYMKRGGVLLDG